MGENNQTVASLARQMYNQGYDLRHYTVGAGSPAIIEILIRTYHFLSLVLLERPQFSNPADEEIWRQQNDAKLNAMLFFSHAIAAGVNAGKVAFHAYHPPFVQALISINIAQWQVFGAATVGYIRAYNRDLTLEHIRRNHGALEKQWTSLPQFELMLPEEPVS